MADGPTPRPTSCLGSVDSFSHASKVVTYLILGDGDFTYSLDLARFLRRQQTKQLTVNNPVTAASSSATSTCASGAINSNEPNHSFLLLCTGLDSHQELTRKYRDAPFVLKSLQQLESHPILNISIHHGVNALSVSSSKFLLDRLLYRNTNGEVTNGEKRRSAEDLVIIFNHPHLGIEDCVRHAQFLSHMFHSLAVTFGDASPVTNGEDQQQSSRDPEETSQPRSHRFRNVSLHLTLANGQCERWDCITRAQRYNWDLRHRCVFRPPPAVVLESHVDDEGGRNQQRRKPKRTAQQYYTLRRHQTGKSFHNRIPGKQSETLVFVLRHGQGCAASSDRHDLPDGGHSEVTRDSLLPWYMANGTATGPDIDNQAQAPPLACQYCDKSFYEERSLKSHIGAKHGKEEVDDNSMESQPPKRVKSATNLTCDQCPPERREWQTFASEEALKEHILAKHTGAFTYIVPDWSAAAAADQNTAKEETDFGKCTICDYAFASEADVMRHEGLFLPEVAEEPRRTNSAVCTTCGRIFQQERSRMQHENLCRHRQATGL